MNRHERAELDYDNGHTAGSKRKRSGEKVVIGKLDFVSSEHKTGFLDGYSGKPHRYKSGKRKRHLL